MPISIYLTNAQKVMALFGSNDHSIINEIIHSENKALSVIDKEMANDLSYKSKDILLEIVKGKYEHRNNEYNFYYGLVYDIICEFYGEKLNSNEFYHDNDVNFIYDKFSIEILKKNYYFPLPEFDFPDFISLGITDIEILENLIDNTNDYKTQFFDLKENELHNLKNLFLTAIKTSREKKSQIVFMIID